MRTWTLSVLAICTLVVFILIAILKGDSPATDPVQSVALDVQEGVVAFMGKTVRGGEELSVSPGNEPVLIGPTPVAAEVPQPTSTPVPKPPAQSTQTAGSEALQLRLVDALGDPIPNGLIEIAGSVHHATQETLTLFNLSPGAHTLIAHANGYESVEKAVSIPAPTPIAITLEYLCTFVVEVHDKKEEGKPVEGAEVIVWEGPAVQRPVPKTATVIVSDSSFGHSGARRYPVQLQRDGDTIRVVRADGFRGESIHTASRKTAPQIGDIVVGIDGSMWRPGDRHQLPLTDYLDLYGRPIHSRLRLWDTLVTVGPLDGGSSYIHALEIEREGTRLNCGLRRPDVTSRGKQVAKGVTGPEGRCRFDNLPPRVYFAQARRRDVRSKFCTLRPSHNWEKAPLITSSENRISVEVRKAGLQNPRHRQIVYADLQLKGRKGMVVLSGMTGGKGTGRFKSATWGDYNLTVTPPPELDARPSSKTMGVSVEEPETRVIVEFDVDSRYIVSGKVLHAETKEPVQGYSLKIRNRAEYQDYGTVSSGPDGRFEFTHIPNGEHEIESVLNPFIYNGFVLGVKRSDEANGRLKSEELRIQVDDADVKDLECHVLPGIRTQFMGSVTTPQGRPIEGAYVYLIPGPSGFVDSGLRTDDQGRFELALILPDTDYTYETDIIACEVESRDRASARVGNITYSSSFGSSVGWGTFRVRMRGTTVAKGTSPVAFRAGETVRDIRIVVEGERGSVVEGTIKGRDGGLPQFVQYYNISAFQAIHASELGVSTSVAVHSEDSGVASQEISRGMSHIEPDGSYFVEKLEPGPVRLRIRPHDLFEKRVDGNALLPPTVSYQPQVLEFVIPEGTEPLRVDIVLEPGSYLRGKITNKSGRPVPRAEVNAVSPKSNVTRYTNEVGSFLIQGLPPGVEHTLSVTPQNRVERTKLDGVKPPTDNIIFVVDNEPQ